MQTLNIGKFKPAETDLWGLNLKVWLLFDMKTIKSEQAFNPPLNKKEATINAKQIQIDTSIQG